MKFKCLVNGLIVLWHATQRATAILAIIHSCSLETYAPYGFHADPEPFDSDEFLGLFQKNYDRPKNVFAFLDLRR